MPDLRYPIGVYHAPETITSEHIETWITEISELPVKLKSAVAGLSDEQLDTPYRPEGWTVRQLVHHISDSHLNAMIRYKWALTEDNPTIKAYNEKKWAELPDTKTDIAISLDLLTAFHKKWVVFLRTLEPRQLTRTFVHPETKKQLSLDWMTGLYAWHGKHHTAHITSLRERMGW